MPPQILVTYGTKYGSTEQVAEVVAEVLRDRGLGVDLKPAREVKSPEAYAAVVVGAPLYIGALHKDALNFLTRNQQTLVKHPVAVFGLGPIHDDEKERLDSLDQLKKELAKLPWLAPVSVEMFGGKFNPAGLRFPDSLLLKLPASPLHDAPASDVRDWTKIRAWASDLAAKLQPVTA